MVLKVCFREPRADHGAVMQHANYLLSLSPLCGLLPVTEQAVHATYK